MSENIQSEAIKSKEHDRDELLLSSEKAVSKTEEASPNLLYDKQQLFVEKANSTFQELCKTLENEQNKLSELETRRKKLQEEMLLLKSEIEEEMKSLNVNIERSVAEQLNALNNASNFNDKLTDESQTVSENLKQITLYTCYEQKEHQHITPRNFHVKSDQNMLAEDTIE